MNINESSDVSSQWARPCVRNRLQIWIIHPERYISLDVSDAAGCQQANDESSPSWEAPADPLSRRAYSGGATRPRDSLVLGWPSVHLISRLFIVILHRRRQPLSTRRIAGFSLWPHPSSIQVNQRNNSNSRHLWNMNVFCLVLNIFIIHNSYVCFLFCRFVVVNIYASLTVVIPCVSERWVFSTSQVNLNSYSFSRFDCVSYMLCMYISLVTSFHRW